MPDDDLEELREELHALFHPEPDEDGIAPREYPHPRLRDFHGLDFRYMESYNWEGASTHQYTRLCPEGDERIRILTRNQDVPTRLCEAALQLYGDSLLAYHDTSERRGQLHYYPPVILTFWSGFETFVRISSERMLTTVPGVPREVAAFLRDEEFWVDRKGEVRTRTRFQPVLDRYAVFLKHGYKLEVDRGSRIWQQLEQAKELRDYYTHLDIDNPRALSSDDVLDFMEHVLLGIIWPSSLLQRSLLLGIYFIYDTWAVLRERTQPYVEQPFFLDWHLGERYLFHCNFEGVDAERYPNMEEEQKRREDTTGVEDEG
jgi:hypothetical protein